jgi:hypothetical protein
VEYSRLALGGGGGTFNLLLGRNANSGFGGQSQAFLAGSGRGCRGFNKSWSVPDYANL